jgi:hypothetical protein
MFLNLKKGGKIARAAQAYRAFRGIAIMMKDKAPLSIQTSTTEFQNCKGNAMRANVTASGPDKLPNALTHNR